MDGNDKKEKVVCCFCGASLEIDEAVSLVVFPQVNGEESQQLFCHKKCLNDRLDKSIPRHPDLIV